MKGTVKSKDDMERLFREGRRSSSYLMTVLVMPSPTANDGIGRCGFIAGKKLGVAPLRSRCKRVMREVARELGGPWNGYDVVFIAKRKAATANHQKLVKDARRQLEGLGVLNV